MTEPLDEYTESWTRTRRVFASIAIRLTVAMWIATTAVIFYSVGIAIVDWFLFTGWFIAVATWLLMAWSHFCLTDDLDIHQPWPIGNRTDVSDQPPKEEAT